MCFCLWSSVCFVWNTHFHSFWSRVKRSRLQDMVDHGEDKWIPCYFSERLILLAVIAGAALGRFENQVSSSIQTHDTNLHVLGVHDVAALTHRSDGLMGVHSQRVNCRGHSPRFAVTSTSVCCDVKLYTVWDTDLTSVTNFMTARSLPGIFSAGSGHCGEQGYENEHQGTPVKPPTDGKHPHSANWFFRYTRFSWSEQSFCCSVITPVTFSPT